MSNESLIEACETALTTLVAWQENFAGGDEHKRTVINTLIVRLQTTLERVLVESASEMSREQQRLEALRKVLKELKS